ncbi:MAG: MBL fold metallo-hydrolase [bacterium]|nr:MBL fold metallo-hydrolase [bacterium]
MRILDLFDKETIDKKFHIGWGLSFLIDNSILFDTGEKGDWLIANMRKLRINLDTLEAVVISHDHWDHTGGLWDILKLKKGMKVYGCTNFSKEFKDKVAKLQGELILADRFVEIAKDIFITGEIPGAYNDKYMPEQAVVLKTRKGLIIITGCAHPGILKIIEKVKTKFLKEPVNLVLGGFHLLDADKRAIELIGINLQKKGVIKVGPTHCSGEAAAEILKKQYGKNFIPIKTGQRIKI